METLKIWCLGLVLSGGAALLAPGLRGVLGRALAALCARGYRWLFSVLPVRLDFTAIAPGRQAKARACVLALVENLVRLEEILLPDGGLGSERKKRVLARLAACGLPPMLAEFACGLIDEAVARMNAEALAALKKYGNNA